MGDGRIRAASNIVKTIGGLLEVYDEPLSGAASQQRIDLLHSDSNDMDLVPPTEDDPYAEPLQVTPDQLRQHLHGLSFDSAAANTVWTHCHREISSQCNYSSVYLFSHKCAK